MKSFRRLALIGILVVLVVAAFGLVQQPEAPAQANTVFRLQAPAFMSVARAAEEESITSVIEDEAGISAYFDAASTINLDNVRPVFRTIEYEDEYCIIGSVEVENYPESEDVHVYVDVDGRFLAYYLAADPVGKIFDWRAYRDSVETDLTTKLENTLVRVAEFALKPYTGCTYYDFRYPNATHLILIAEWTYHTHDTFEVFPPGSYTYWERSWSAGGTWSVSYTLDGVTLFTQNPQTWLTTQGYLTQSQLLPEQYHTVDAYGYQYGYGGLALVYEVP